MRLFLAVAHDVEGAVVVLDVSVVVPHVFVGIAVLECHGNCHNSNFQLSRQKRQRRIVTDASCDELWDESAHGLKSRVLNQNSGAAVVQRIFSGIEFSASRIYSASSLASLTRSLLCDVMVSLTSSRRRT